MRTVILARRAAAISQSELAALAGTSQAHISRVESGKMDPSVALLKEIAKALDCTLTIKLERNNARR